MSKAHGSSVYVVLCSSHCSACLYCQIVQLQLLELPLYVFVYSMLHSPFCTIAWWRTRSGSVVAPAAVSLSHLSVYLACPVSDTVF